MSYTYRIILLQLFSFFMVSSVFGEVLPLNSSCSIFSNDRLIFQTIININYKFNKSVSDIIGDNKKSREYWYIDCNLLDNKCRGFHISLDNAYNGKGVNLMDANFADDLDVISKSNKLITLKWGSYRTFTVDFELSRVEYRESGPTTEGRGIGKCKDN